MDGACTGSRSRYIRLVTASAVNDNRGRDGDERFESNRRAMRYSVMIKRASCDCTTMKGLQAPGHHVIWIQALSKDENYALSTVKLGGLE